MEYNEAKLQKLLFCEFAGRSIVVPNAHFRNSRWEMDALVITKAGYSYEYEIKCTKADFKNEFKKKATKHRYMEAGFSKRYHANYYSILCPEELITIEDVEELNPKYGLWWANRYWMKCQKKPVKLHDETISDKYYRALCVKLMYKIFNHCDKYTVRQKQ